MLVAGIPVVVQFITREGRGSFCTVVMCRRPGSVYVAYSGGLVEQEGSKGRGKGRGKGRDGVRKRGEESRGREEDRH